VNNSEYNHHSDYDPNDESSLNTHVNNSDVNNDNHIYVYTYLSDCRYLYIYIHEPEPTSGDLAITNPEII
jgi:hypothetical protein